MYAIRFDFPTDDGPLYAGIYQGAAGFAPTLKTAELYETADDAAAMLHNAYGQELPKWGRVITVVDENERPYEVVKR